MPYFQLKGKPILPNNTECPAEVIKNTWGGHKVESGTFFVKNHYDPANFEVTGHNMTLKCEGLVYTLTPTGDDPYAEAPHEMVLDAGTECKITIHSHYVDDNTFAPIEIFYRAGDESYSESRKLTFASQNQSHTFTAQKSASYYLRFDATLGNGASTRQIIIDSLVVAPIKYRVELTGVSDRGYQLVSPDGNSDVPWLNDQDVFEGRLQINGQVQKYCAKGMAPIGTLLKEWNGIEGGGCSFDGYADGTIKGRPWDGSAEFYLSTPTDRHNVLTFVLQGAGGGGGCAYATSPAGGGAAGALAVCTVYFDPSKCPEGGAEIGYFSIGGGGSGATALNAAGDSGGTTSLVIHSKPGTIDGLRRIDCKGGQGGYGGQLTYAGWRAYGGIVETTNIDGADNIFLGLQKVGSAGGNIILQGDSFPETSTYIFTVNNTKITYPEVAGGTVTGANNSGAGGGSSAFGNGGNGVIGTGNSGGVGAGGAGGGLSPLLPYKGGNGGHGHVSIYY